MSADRPGSGRAALAAAWTRGIALAGLVAICALPAGCDRNSANPYLVPTGVRPKPATGTGAVVGRVLYDPTQSPDLVDPPYPVTVVELYESGEVFATDTLDRNSTLFEFRQLPPGTYTAVATAPPFRRSSVPPVRVVDREVDAGDLIMPVDIDQLTTISVHLYGDFNGFAELPDSCSMQQFKLGVWFGPNLDPIFDPSGEIPPDSAITLAAGVHQIRFVTNFVVDNPTDYGGDQSVVIDAPIAQATVALVSGPGTNLSIRVPETGRYRFFLDERRPTFSIERVPDGVPPSAVAARRTTR